MTSDPTKRFTERVDNYVKYRPGYPDEVIDFLQNECGLTEESVIADIGSGTGIFTKLLLDKGYIVYAVEPNQAMQQAAKQWLGSNENYTAIDAIAEATTLPPKSIDLVVCAQAFHWFNDERTRAEFKRILKDGSSAALIWNNRLADTDDFSRAYENLLKNGSLDYNKVNHRNITDIDFKAFFKNGQYKQVNYQNAQVFDLDGLMGRAFSSSYVPPQNSEEGKKFRELLQGIFAKYNVSGKVSFQYQTEIYIGQV
ncbi:MAG: Methyltransferase protein [Mucilaginibacter sp.]|nr:Methyltransferase protein [Mucilaginibacter sp.]